MSTENGSCGEQIPAVGGQLSENVVESMKAQENDGTIQVSVPKTAAQDLGIEKGDTLLVTGRAGDRDLIVRPSASVFADD